VAERAEFDDVGGDWTGHAGALSISLRAAERRTTTAGRTKNTSWDTAKQMNSSAEESRSSPEFIRPRSLTRRQSLKGGRLPVRNTDSGASPRRGYKGERRPILRVESAGYVGTIPLPLDRLVVFRHSRAGETRPAFEAFLSRASRRRMASWTSLSPRPEQLTTTC
jgi:hypothetical protein